MIIQCQGCAARYFLPEDKIPHDPIRVRCPKCKSVFTLAPRHETVPAGAAAAPVSPAQAPVSAPAERPAAAHAPASGPASEAVPSLETPPATERSKPAEEPAGAVAEPPPVASPAEKPAGTRTRRGQSKEDRARRLARVLVSDILCYNRETRDQALQDGTLMTALGEEIKKSWELYKDKVGADVAGSTNHFKDALNEILADGQEVF